ncbi:isoprenyl transferase [Geothermobacter hydrogeniphilus]|uniref:Isoprenyl transferase n=1 Tax=Geothermobacter hydrogeniphilus TaxID=1969733 RepID=A0A2K2H969_9BACT|nr:isoprenyl transferase [Geothermobacter hydrogeniphilus]PNU19811.1 isoprenyl transferase [Geothermobacter hydrogeniphilus]
MHIPRHLAIIMDGNGRWAENRCLPRIAGHRQGVRTVREIVQECQRLGVDYLTLYAFSSENWGRPDDEVSALMELLSIYLREQFDLMLEKRIRLRVIGEIERLPLPVRRVLEETVAKTGDHDGMVLTLALSYGARNEILRASQRLAARVAAGELSPDAIDEELFAGSLDTSGMPDPDLLIRTSGEMRISNFLLWQIAYAEMVFTPVLWPDFGVEELHWALTEFTRRERRFGLTRDQVDCRSGEKGH